MKRQTTDAQRVSPRGNRIAAKVQTIVAEILRDKFSEDPVLSTISLVGSDAHGGLSFVRLYYYTNSDATIAQARLDSATKMIRYELASRLDQKYTPEIKFAYDDTIERANRIEELLKNVQKNFFNKFQIGKNKRRFFYTHKNTKPPAKPSTR